MPTEPAKKAPSKKKSQFRKEVDAYHSWKHRHEMLLKSKPEEPGCLPVCPDSEIVYGLMLDEKMILIADQDTSIEVTEEEAKALHAILDKLLY